MVLKNTIVLKDQTFDDRLNCFGKFDSKDNICLLSCALNINCAIAKNNYLHFNGMDDSISSIMNYERYEGES